MSLAPVTVLLYHEIVDARAGWRAGPGCISRATFEAHVEALCDAGFRFVSLADAFRLACKGGADRGEAARLPPAVAMTFDDGYEGCARVLWRHAERLRPTIFLLSNCLGGSNLSWNSRAPAVLRHMTLHRAQQLADAGVALEAHGIDHHNLLKFGERELRRRFAAVQRWFQNQLGRRASYLAYPYGACNRTIQSTAKEFFAGAVSVNHGHWEGARAQFALNRISVPFYLRAGDLIDAVRIPGPDRWRAIEQKAPWHA
jgi:peptidoglycan/xylan/chitin deacetylase (PgdA/CDA1 family)